MALILQLNRSPLEIFQGRPRHLELHGGIDKFRPSKLSHNAGHTFRILRHRFLAALQIPHRYQYLATHLEVASRNVPLISHALLVRRQIFQGHDKLMSPHHFPGPPLESLCCALDQLYRRLLKNKIHNQEFELHLTLLLIDWPQQLI